MVYISLPNRFSDNFGDPINAIFKLLSEIEALEDDLDVEMDYSKARFTHPFFSIAIPLIILQQKKSNNRNLKINDKFEVPSVADYMKYIYFPNGVNPSEIENANFEEFLFSYEAKTYIPIISFPVGHGKITTDTRDQFLSCINKLLINICKLNGSLITAMMYLIDEAVNNVLHHSYDDEGYLHAQYYPSKGYIDLAIADIGRTILESYQNSDKFKEHIFDDEEAMRAALDGKSTKSNNVDRGFGISTSKEMLTKGLNGKYFLFSGNVINIHTSERNEIVKMEQTIYWQGVLLCLRIPVVAKPGFNPTDYYE